MLAREPVVRRDQHLQRLLGAQARRHRNDASPRLEPELGLLEGEPSPLEGGITNRNYRVRMGGEDLVLRLCDRGAEVLGIDRSTEEIASRRAAAEGIAPPVVAFLSDVPALVTRWLPGGDVAKSGLFFYFFCHRTCNI